MNTKKFNLPNMIIGIILFAWAILIFYPFYSSILISFMTEQELMRTPFPLYVKNVTFDSYKEILSNSKIINGYKTTLFVLVTGVPLSLFLSSTLAYALSRKSFLLSKTVNNMVVFTMFFSGGIIPVYLQIRTMGLMGSLWSVILTGAVNTYNMILIKSYFYTIPDSLEESAKLDGANDLIIFARIFMPLAKPILATVLLFVCVEKWNEWYSSMLFISDANKWPLQLVLREIISNVAQEVEADDGLLSNTDSFPTNVRMATIVVTMVPIMIVYPFLQKYFMKGIMIGAVKS